MTLYNVSSQLLNAVDTQTSLVLRAVLSRSTARK
jgi:hypothetical protein